jgi:plastocyanin
LRSADSQYLSKNGYDPSANAFNQLADFLQNGNTANGLSGNPTAYQTAVALGKVGQFGNPVDMTKSSAVTIDMVDAGTGMYKYTPINVKVKVGTVITWVNKSSQGHTVSAITGDGSSIGKVSPQIFNSGDKDHLVQPGQNYTYKVTSAAYTFNQNHTVVYYCQIHPTMLGQLTIVQ